MIEECCLALSSSSFTLLTLDPLACSCTDSATSLVILNALIASFICDNDR